MFWLRALYVLNGLAIGMLYSFVPVLLQARGFEPALVGLTISLGSVGFMLALPVWGHVGDIVSGPRRALQVACIPAAVFGLGLAAPIPVAGIILCQIVLSAGGGPSMALTDAMAMPVLKDPSREYSRLRLLTSLGGAAGAVGGGLIYARTGYLVAPFVYVFIMGAVILCAQFVPLGRDSERHRKARGLREGTPHHVPERGRFGSVGEALSGRPVLLAVLSSVLLVFFGVMASATYLSLRITDLGGGPAQVGLANGIGSFAEVPGLLLAGWLTSRLGLRAILLLSCAGFAACVASWSAIVSIEAILVTRLLSGIFFGGILVAFVVTVARLLPARLQSTGQTLFQSVAFGLGAVLANLIGGILYSAVGPIGVFGGAAACVALGGAVGFLAVPVAAVDGAAAVAPEATPAAG